MRHVLTRSGQKVTAHAALWAALVVASALAPTADAAETSQIWQVEEEWELIVAEPDASTAGPQVTCTISPRGDLSGRYATFELNHKTAPAFSAGGVHLHFWNGETRLGTVSRGSQALLSNSGETIRWRAVMTLQNGALTVDIDDGTSTTWEAFGDGVLLTVPTSLTNLNLYSPAVSVQHSGVGFASNRVQSLKLKKVTARTTDGQTLVDTTERVLHTLD